MTRVRRSSQNHGNAIWSGAFSVLRRRITIRIIRPIFNRGRESSGPQTRRDFMSRISTIRVRAIAISSVVLAALGGMAVAADRYTLQVPNGLAFSDFRGYEDWQVVSIAQTDEVLKVIVANPAMIAAYKAGVPGNGRKFPDGSKIAKIQWKPKKSTEAPFSVNVPDTLQDVFFIEKDSRRFPATSGWGYAQFDYNPASDTFAPDAGG